MKKYLPLIPALGAPLIFIIGTLLFVLLSGPEPPENDFIFIENRTNPYYIDERGILQTEDDDDVALWRYHMGDDREEEISLREAQQLTLMEDSPEGFEVEYRRRSGLQSLFGGRGYSGFYAQKNSKGYKLDLDRSSHRFTLIGWVK